jgi:ParB family transcriptional regulator, chromosome partitioning protein
MDKNKKSGLGRGLQAILPGNYEVLNKAVGEVLPPNWEIDIDKIVEVNNFQPRTHFDELALEELAESIKLHGVIQPITVRELSKGKYQLISGERRFRASKLAGLKKIPAYIRKADDQQMLEMALIENIQREDLNAIEVALSYQRLQTECNLKQDELGDRVGKNRSTITNYLRLLKLPPDIQAAIRDKKISMGHARALISIERVQDQLEIFKKTIQNDLSVRQVEELVKGLKANPKKPKPEVEFNISPEINKLQKDLSSHFGTKVAILCDIKGKGEIKIPFVSEEDLNRILELLKD